MIRLSRGQKALLNIPTSSTTAPEADQAQRSATDSLKKTQASLNPMLDSPSLSDLHVSKFVKVERAKRGLLVVRNKRSKRIGHSAVTEGWNMAKQELTLKSPKGMRESAMKKKMGIQRTSLYDGSNTSSRNICIFLGRNWTGNPANVKSEGKFK
ncbi:hypothetical protein GQ43DRAFT_465826 [Delitschia confertaspora ATCC 74209]|uniref:Uncharacterized protein n=1 Tax=Delitschia confertaspora ATCC 74209 TaxID=1513339 RepID=A0A9P4MPF4_9PLEO|nr:hypothetical protein GQ43DRAFT_465826 [Delitschia confertaspora ATCC 74209]